MPEVSHIDTVRAYVRSTFSEFEADSTVAVTGIPAHWDGDAAHNRIVRAAAMQLLVNVRRVSVLPAPRFCIVLLTR